LSQHERDVLTTGEVARLCNVAPRTVSKWVDTGQLRGYRIPGSKDRRIPRQQLIRFMKAHGMPLAAVEGDQLRVVIADPDRDLTGLLERTLCDNGRCRVAAANTAFEAGALAQELQPHVLVVDLDVPGMNPTAVSRFLKGRIELQSTRLIATGASLSEAENALLQEGFDATLPKPYHIRDLRTLIEQLLSRQ
jgi:excisionase family DNA binding protein